MYTLVSYFDKRWGMGKAKTGDETMHEKKDCAVVLDLDGVLWDPYVAFDSFCRGIDLEQGQIFGSTRSIYDVVRKEVDGSRLMDIFFDQIARKVKRSESAVKREYFDAMQEFKEESLQGMAFAKLGELKNATRRWNLILFTKGSPEIQVQKIDAMGDEREACFRDALICGDDKTKYAQAIVSAYNRVVFVDDKLSELQKIIDFLWQHGGIEQAGFCWFNGSSRDLPPLRTGKFLIADRKDLFALLKALFAAIEEGIQ